MKDYEGIDLSRTQIEIIERALAFLLKANQQVQLLNEQLMHIHMLPVTECRAHYEISRAYLELCEILREDYLTSARREKAFAKSTREKLGELGIL